MAVSTIFCALLILLSLSKNIDGQTCHGRSQYDLCSSNNGCGCLQLSISNDVSICAILGVSCSRLRPCQLPGETCENSDHICVHHPRCNSATPLCYPLSMVDQRLCPPSSSPISSSTTTITPTGFPTWNATGSTPTWNTTVSIPTWNGTVSPSWNATGSTPTWNATVSPSWNTTRFSTWNATGSTPTWNATGSTPTWNTTVSIPTWNATVSPSWNTTRFPTWNATGSTPTWNATVSTSTWNVTQPTSTNGSIPASVYSYYSNALTMYSSVCPGTINKYYQIVNIFVKTSGLYNFTSTSYMDTIAVLYKDGFSPLNLNWHIVSSVNTFDINRQFKLSHYLIAGAPYTLLVTTNYYGQTGAFTVIASGSDYLHLF